MKKITTFIKNYHLPILSGVLIGTTYIPFPTWSILFCYIPLWLFWIRNPKNYNGIFISGFITQFVLSLIGFFWIIHTAHEFGGLPWAVSFLALILFSALAHLHIPLSGMISSWLIERVQLKSPLKQGLIFASTLGLFEIYWPYLFQWHLGYTLLWSQFPIFQFADLIGFQGLSYLLLIFNAVLFSFLPNLSQKPLFFKKVSLTLVVFFVINLLGSFWGYQFEKKMNQTYQKHKFLAVQANIGNLERVFAERGTGYQDYIANTYIRMTQKALDANLDFDMIVWPESAFPEYLDSAYIQSSRGQLITTQIKNWNKPLITGSYSKDPPGQKDRKTYNALSFFEKDGTLVEGSPYQKHHLLAFGEYTPFSNIFPILSELSPAGSGFGRGTGPRVLNLNQIAVGPQICYEALYPEFSKELAKKGAQIIINATNDSWFGPHFEPEQHLYMTLARSIENRLSLLRVTNTGFTTAIEPNGKLLEKSPLFAEWSQVFELHLAPRSSLTFYAEFGHLLPLLIILIIGGIIATKKFRSSES